MSLDLNSFERWGNIIYIKYVRMIFRCWWGWTFIPAVSSWASWWPFCCFQSSLRLLRAQTQISDAAAYWWSHQSSWTDQNWWHLCFSPETLHGERNMTEYLTAAGTAAGFLTFTGLCFPTIRVVVNWACKVTDPKVCVVLTSGGDVGLVPLVLLVHLV